MAHQPVHQAFNTRLISHSQLFSNTDSVISCVYGLKKNMPGRGSVNRLYL